MSKPVFMNHRLFSRCSDGTMHAWDPSRSKLAAAFLLGLSHNPFKRNAVVLYLGAAQGNTALHMARLMARGIIFAMDKSVDEIEALLKHIAEHDEQRIIWPMLADAAHPEAYAGKLCLCDVLYQDLAQRDQTGVFLANARFLKNGGTGFLCIKARSIDVTADPKNVFAQCERELKGHFEILQRIDLDAYEKDHCMFVVRKC